MFAALYLERDPLRLGDLGRNLISWVLDVGGFAAVGIVIWVIVRAVSPSGWRFGAVPGYDPPTSDPRYSPPPAWVSVIFTWAVILSAVVYVVFFLSHIPVFRDIVATMVDEEIVPGQPLPPNSKIRVVRVLIHLVAAFLAMVAILVPFLDHLFKLRWRRIWGLSKLAFKEAVRRRVPYVFAAFFLLLLFLTMFVPSNPDKPEQQLQTYVTVVFWTLTPLMLLSAGLVSAFSIPNDIRNQTIHTVTTKPVERFELVLGRWIGYMMLMTLIHFVLVTVSVLFVLREIHPDARAHSLTARVPHYGDLKFFKVTNEDDPGREERLPADPREQNVGREWDYFKYISGTNINDATAPRLYAEWEFADVPKALTERDFVRCEFNFDVYRTNKGKENEGLTCSFFFQTRHFDKLGGASKKYLDEQQAQGGPRNAPEKGKKFSPDDNDLSEKWGYFEAQGIDITDYHTQYVDVPAGLIRSAVKPGGSGPALTVRVRCESKDQFVGMARYHLYLRRDNPTGGGDTLAFALNFYKGSLGVWLATALLVGLCVFLSVQLGGILSLICGLVLFLSGLAREFILEVVSKQSVGGGPAEGFLRLVRRENMATPLEDTTINKVASASDDVFRVALSKFMNLLPDTERLSFTDRVANGFDVGLVGTDLLPTTLMVFGYLLPWAVLAFYLIKSREIAGAH